MAGAAPQRIYRAPCPGCGAPVEFRSAQSTHAVCSFCRSTVVRAGETLSRLGRMAEVFEDYSLLQLMATGRFQGQAFTLVGRLQYRSGSGSWAEWEAAFDDGRMGQLSEDNGSHVFSFPASLQREVPAAEHFRLEARTAVAGQPFTVTANEQAMLVSAQGELGRLPPLDRPFAFVELRSADGEVLDIDYGSAPPQVSRGRAVRLEELQLAGLRAEAARQEQARAFACPHCGAPVQVQLEGMRSITCPSCDSLVDATRGIAGELRHAEQHEPVRPLIPLGSSGRLQGTQWQVVGFRHRMGTEPGDGDEHFGRSEYLLYNRKRGFLFLVDTEAGWLLLKASTGAPTLSQDQQSATHLGTRYQLTCGYHAETGYVAGEFYWPVERGQRTFNRDFASGNKRLAMEQSAREVTWSSGTTIASDTVARAFGLQARAADFSRGDAGPASGRRTGHGCLLPIVLGIALLAILLVLPDEDPRFAERDAYRQREALVHPALAAHGVSQPSGRRH